MGIWVEEIDALYDDDRKYVVLKDDNELGITGEYETGFLCSLLHAETAEVLATYKEDFYAGRPALTVNKFGKGEAYYIASRNEELFLNDFYDTIINELALEKVLDIELPAGVTVQKRTDGEKDYIFVMNFTGDEQKLNMNLANELKDIFSGEEITGKIELGAYGVEILSR